MRDPVVREPAAMVRARRTVEGGGFVARHPLPPPDPPRLDPFLPLDETGPVVRAPFVTNTRAEIRQAVDHCRSGRSVGISG